MSSISVQEVRDAAIRVISSRPQSPVSCSALRLYNGAERAEVVELCGQVGLPYAPITEHIVDPKSGVYIHASKQWEYVYAMEQISDHHGYMGSYAPMRIADVGGGRGALAPYLAKLGAHVTQFDLDYQWGGNALTESSYRAWAADHSYRARFGSIYNLPVADSSYDVVLCISVLEHLPHKDAALRELLRLVRPGGMLVLTFDFALETAMHEDKMRVEIMNPERLRELLGGIGISGAEVPDAAVRDSVACIQRDSVLGIPDGMTVAGMVLQKTGVAVSENGRAAHILEAVAL